MLVKRSDSTAARRIPGKYPMPDIPFSSECNETSIYRTTPRGHMDRRGQYMPQGTQGISRMQYVIHLWQVVALYSSAPAAATATPDIKCSLSGRGVAQVTHNGAPRSHEIYNDPTVHNPMHREPIILTSAQSETTMSGVRPCTRHRSQPPETHSLSTGTPHRDLHIVCFSPGPLNVARNRY